MNATAWVILVGAALLVACDPSPDFRIVGETVKQLRGAALPEQSPFFDGKRLALRGVRGEVLGFQILVADRESVDVQMPAPIAVHAFRTGYVTVSDPSTAMYGTSTGAGVYPDPLFPTRGPVEADKAAYYDIEIPPGTPTGRYTGQIRVGDSSYELLLQVEPIEIDLEQNPLVWAFYLPGALAKAAHLRDDDGERLIALESAYAHLFRRHGVLLASALRPYRFPPRRSFVRNVRYWPVAVDASSPHAAALDTQRWLELFAESSVVPFTIPVDEPRDAKQRLHARRIAEAIRAAGGGRPKFLTAVTDVADASYGDAFDIYVSPRNIPTPAAERRATGERFWTYNGRPPRAGSMIIDSPGVSLRTWGWIAFRYDVELWYAWEALYFSDRYNDGGPTDPFENPVTFDERRTGGEDHGNGDGLLAYPGRIPSLRLKALRRGLQDRLLLNQLAECGGSPEAKLIAHDLVPRALGEAETVQAWPLSEQPWVAARNRVIDSILRRCTHES